MSSVRRLRAIALNGLVWGGAWFVGVMLLATVANLVDPPAAGVVRWGEGLELAVPGAILFTVAGMVFSAVITLVLRGRRLAEISWIRFGLGGGAVSFLFLPTFISVMRFFSGDGMLPLTKLLGTGALGLVFGGVAAAGTLKLAQLADRYFPGKTGDGPELLEGDRSAPSMQRNPEWSAHSRKTK
jgi:hypothetical protein